MKSLKKYSLWLAGIVIGVTLFNLMFYSDPITFRHVKMMLLWTFVYTVVLGFGNAFLAQGLDKFYDWYTQTSLRVVSGLVFTIVYSVLGSILVLTIMLVIPGKLEFTELFSAHYLKQHYYTTIISMVVSLFFHLRGFLIEWKVQVKLNEEIKRKQLESELASLQKQMDAHFLFNSLSVLREVILEDQELAARFVEDFSSVYRYIVDNSSKKLVALRDELTFIKQYVFLHETRFEDAIVVNYDLKNCDKTKQVLPLSVQIAIENAIRHNVFSDKDPLIIDITCVGQSIFVKNNLRVKAKSEGAGMALKNLESRLRLMSDRVLNIERTKEYYQVEIPLL